ncbi:MAG TPA: VIT1/CCC1 transporter family protein [Candidatus Saccharimonadales bacterium]|nr:VIT1/CCC1 transporter family protein [Candidatus Saccharimonadales bacterium]
MTRNINPFSWPIGRANRLPRTEEEHNRFILQTIQPGLAGLMDGSVSTLAPIFAAAFATHKPHVAFLIGISAAVGAGISMAFAEALSDTGELTGRGRPFRRGVIIGLMTFLGGIFHTIPFLMSNIHAALTIAYLVVGIELMIIAYIRYRYFQMRFWLSIVQVVVGGGLVFLAGILIGSA